MLNAFKQNKKNYIECFLGSAVVLINVLKNNDKLNYKNFYVNDINSNIINFYKLLQKKSDYLMKHIYRNWQKCIIVTTAVKKKNIIMI